MKRPFHFAVRASRPGPDISWRDMARRAEDLGYRTFLMSDHVAGPGIAMERTGHPPGGLAVAPALMALADATTKLRIGSRVSCIDYHHPVVLAKEMATIDLLSEGRLAEQLGATFGLSISEIMSHPHTLLGSVDYLCDELERRRDVYNISYVSIPEDQAVAFAPVVHRLADK